MALTWRFAAAGRDYDFRDSVLPTAAIENLVKTRWQDGPPTNTMVFADRAGTSCGNPSRRNQLH